MEGRRRRKCRSLGEYVLTRNLRTWGKLLGGSKGRGMVVGLLCEASAEQSLGEGGFHGAGER